MRCTVGHGIGAAVCALMLLATGGCASLHHRKSKSSTPHCPEPAISPDVKNMPPLRVPPGLDAPDTRNAIKVPPLTEPQLARAPTDPCLSSPPSFGKQLAAYTGPSLGRVVNPFFGQVYAGGALTMGHSSSFLNSGWTVGGSFIYRPRPQGRFALQLDLGYADFNASRKLVGLGQQNLKYSIDSGHGDVWSLSLSGRYTVPMTPRVNAYGLLGIGGYHESLKLTETGIYGGVVCDYWGYCYVVTTPGDIVVASKSLTKLGWSAGLGVEFAMSGRSAWFLETRYHSVVGSKSIQYLPIQIGYRF
jgi:opacity protein-like surface antigen